MGKHIRKTKEQVFKEIKRIDKHIYELKQKITKMETIEAEESEARYRKAHNVKHIPLSARVRYSFPKTRKLQIRLKRLQNLRRSLFDKLR